LFQSNLILILKELNHDKRLNNGVSNQYVTNLSLSLSTVKIKSIFAVRIWI